MRGDAQPGHAVLRKAFVAQPVELAFSGDAGQLGVELSRD